jgi:hypothetical protein
MKQYPTSPEFSKVQIELVDPTLVADANRPRSQSRKVGAPRWKITGEYSLLTRAEHAPLAAFKAAMRGRFSRFTLIVPIESYSAGTVIGAVTVSNNIESGHLIVPVLISGALAVNDYIKFANHDKVYSLAEASSAGQITLTTPLEFPVTIGETVIYNDVPFTVAFAEDDLSYSIQKGNLRSFGVSFEERL